MCIQTAILSKSPLPALTFGCSFQDRPVPWRNSWPSWSFQSSLLVFCFTVTLANFASLLLGQAVGCPSLLFVVFLWVLLQLLFKTYEDITKYLPLCYVLLIPSFLEIIMLQTDLFYLCVILKRMIYVLRMVYYNLPSQIWVQFR